MAEQLMEITDTEVNMDITRSAKIAVTVNEDVGTAGYPLVVTDTFEQDGDSNLMPKVDPTPTSEWS
tara:strand:+ start:628 stop:825 length:198 start_codon:yes stop_codon:yes gene_type:complete